jgi:glycosyltransferase involved in cell wall biosynthesis
MVLAATRTSSVPVVRTEHNPVMHVPGRFERRGIALADRAVDRFVYVSSGNRRRFEQAFPWRKEKGATIVNCVDTRHLPRAATRTRSSQPTDPAGPKTAAFLATGWKLHAADGRRPIEPVLRALATLDTLYQPSLNPWRLLVFGEGDIQGASELARNLGITDRIEFLGFRRDALDLVATCDVLVSASQFEGMSLSFLEAWHLGVPVVSTPVDGISDVLGAEGLARWTAEHGDVDAMARLWKRADGSDPEFEKVHQSATDRVRCALTVAQNKKSIMDLYGQINRKAR